MIPLYWRLRSLVVTRWYLDLRPDPRRTVVVAGSKRSGTTWLANLLNTGNPYRIVFEPLRPDTVPEARGFLHRQYLRPGAGDPALAAALERMVEGRIRNRWTDHINARFWCSRRLIKLTRGNLLLGWLRHRYPDLPLLLLVRHPCPVALSKIRKGLPETYLPELLAQPDLLEDVLAPHVDLLGGLRTDFEKNIALWCIETFVPLSGLGPSGVHLVFYEDLCSRPREVLPGLFAAAGRPPPDGRVYARLDIPSTTSRADSPVQTGGDVLDGWRREVTGEEQAGAERILQAFGLADLYGDDGRPSHEAARRLFCR